LEEENAEKTLAELDKLQKHAGGSTRTRQAGGSTHTQQAACKYAAVHQAAGNLLDDIDD